MYALPAGRPTLAHGLDAMPSSDEAKLARMAIDIPDHLYKYRAIDGDGLDRLERMVMFGELYFAAPESFNDPFDMALDPSFVASNEQLRLFWDEDLRSRFPGMQRGERQKRIKRFILETKTAAGHARVVRVHAKSVKKTGVFCLCENIESTLMWSYYANGHTGVAVQFGFDAPGLESLSPVMVWRVGYTDAVPRVNYYRDSNFTYFTATMATKSLDWAHEREWRFALSNRIGVATVPLRVITAVVFGLRTPAGVRSTIRNWASRRKERLKLLQVVKQPGRYELAIEPATL